MKERNTEIRETEKIYQTIHELEAVTRKYIVAVIEKRDAAAAQGSDGLSPWLAPGGLSVLPDPPEDICGQMNGQPQVHGSA